MTLLEEEIQACAGMTDNLEIYDTAVMFLMRNLGLNNCLPKYAEKSKAHCEIAVFAAAMFHNFQ